MQQKILEIIEFLISQIDASPDRNIPDIEFLSRKLKERGYTENDIQKAVDWITELIQPHFPEASLREGGDVQALRLLDPFERTVFTPEAYAFLIQIQKLRLVNHAQLEQIIDRCLMFGNEIVEYEDVKNITFQLLMGTDMPGSYFYPGNESIH